MKQQTLPLVVVEWNDAWVDGTDPVSPADVAATHKPKVVITMGWVLKDDEQGISLANEHYAGEDTYRGRTFIPRVMVKNVTPFKLAKIREKKEVVVNEHPTLRV